MVKIGNPWALWSLAAIAITVIIWLIRPRPKDVAIPSLMFLMKQQGSAKRATFFKRFSSNALFYFQLAGISLLCIALISPLFNIAYDSAGGSTVIVLDASASMQTAEGATTRFAQAKSAAKKAVKGKTSIILAGSRPVLMLEAGTEDKARSILAAVKAKDTRSNIGDAMVYASDLLGKQGRIVVISDFRHTEGADPQVVKAIVEAKGPVVDFVKVGSPKDNIGIVDLAVSRRETKVYVKNYADEEKAVTLEYDNEFDATRKRLARTVLARSIEPFTFQSGGGITTIRILDKDPLLADNVVFISNPQRRNLKVLLIESKPNRFVKNALLALGNVDVDVAEPPIVNLDAKDYSIFIIGDVDAAKLLPGTTSDIRKKVEQGKSAVILSSDALLTVDYAGLLPIIPEGKAGSVRFGVELQNTITRDVEFGGADEHIRTRELEGTTVLVRTGNDTPIIAYHTIGDGKSFYYGIMDTKSDFKNSPSYPIFWSQLVNFLIGAEDINNFNFRSGKLVAFANEQRIITPSGGLTTTKTILDEAGIYRYDGKHFAVNLLSEKESDISGDVDIEGAKQSASYTPERVEKRRDMNIEIYLIILALLVLITEMFWTKWSGDL